MEEELDDGSNWHREKDKPLSQATHLADGIAFKRFKRGRAVGGYLGTQRQGGA